MQKILALYSAFLRSVNSLQHVLMFGIRVWMANVFWKSGIIKWNQDWDTVVFLFTEEHPVPFLPPEVAAASGMLFELLCPGAACAWPCFAPCNATTHCHDCGDSIHLSRPCNPLLLGVLTGCCAGLWPWKTIAGSSDSEAF